MLEHPKQHITHPCPPCAQCVAASYVCACCPPARTESFARVLERVRVSNARTHTHASTEGAQMYAPGAALGGGARDAAVVRQLCLQRAMQFVCCD